MGHGEGVVFQRSYSFIPIDFITLYAWRKLCFRSVEPTDERSMMELEYFEFHNENLHSTRLGVKMLSVS